MRRLAFLVAAVSLAAPAEAGPASFEANTLHPSDTAGGYITVDGASVAPHLGFTFGIWSGWSHDLLVMRDNFGNVPTGGVVIGQQLALDFVGSFALFDRLELGVDLPYVPRQDVDNSVLALPGGLATSGPGDLRLDLKLRAFTVERGQNRIGLAVIAGLRVPTGDANSFLGNDGVSGYPRLALEWRHPRASVALNFGAVLRSTVSFANLVVGHELAWGGAARVVAGAGFEVLGELRGLVGLSVSGDQLTTSEAPVEGSLGLIWRSPFGLAVTLAGGAGLTRGYGSPDGRVLLGVVYTSPPKYADVPPPPPQIYAQPPEPPPAPPPAPSDRDDDGVPDDRDRCPDQAGVPENDGCPDVDTDGDGLIDRLDKCPFEAEVYNGNADEDGCPDKGAPLLDVAMPMLNPHTPYDGAKVDSSQAKKLLDVIAHLMRQHEEWLKLTVTCTHGRLEGVAECDKRAEAVRHALAQDYGIATGRLDLTSKVDLEKKRGFVIQFQIDDKIDPDAPRP
jgi:hypothetical protein